MAFSAGRTRWHGRLLRRPNSIPDVSHALSAASQSSAVRAASDAPQGPRARRVVCMAALVATGVAVSLGANGDHACGRFKARLAGPSPGVLPGGPRRPRRRIHGQVDIRARSGRACLIAVGHTMTPSRRPLRGSRSRGSVRFDLFEPALLRRGRAARGVRVKPDVYTSCASLPITAGTGRGIV